MPKELQERLIRATVSEIASLAYLPPFNKKPTKGEFLEMAKSLVDVHPFLNDSKKKHVSIFSNVFEKCWYEKWISPSNQDLFLFFRILHTHRHTQTHTDTHTHAHTHTHTHTHTQMQPSKQGGLVNKVISSTMHICQTQFSEALSKMANADHIYVSYWFT